MILDKSTSLKFLSIRKYYNHDIQWMNIIQIINLMDQEEETVEQVVVEVEKTEQESTVPSQRATKVVEFPSEFEWRLEDFSEDDAVKNFSKLADEDLNTQIILEKNGRFYITDAAVKTSGISKTNVYICKGEDDTNGSYQIIRRYSDFYCLRQVLVRRWPGVFIPPVPEKGNIGANDKQISKNKLQILNNFLRRMVNVEAIFNAEEFQTFIKSPDSDVQKNLQKLKPYNIQDQLSLYKGIWPQYFRDRSEEDLDQDQKKIKRFEDYFMAVKVDLVRQKDQMKRLAELRMKLNFQRYQILYRTLPEYEKLCLGWFNGEKKQNNIRKGSSQQKVEEGQEEGKIYSSAKYQNLLEAYKQQLFPDQSAEGWIMYELFKFQIREIDAILQAVTQYKYLINEKKFYTRNLENNKQQIDDINNKKMSLKIFFLSGTEDDKRTQLANETTELQNRLLVAEELWNGTTQLVIAEIEEFQAQRCQFYKKSLMNAFKREALIMSRLFNLYVEAQRL